MRSYQAVAVSQQQFGVSDGVTATWMLTDQNGLALFDANSVAISALYANGVVIATPNYTNNNGSENGNTPSGSITFTSGDIPVAGTTLSWSGTAQTFQYDLTPVLLAQYANSPAMLQVMEFMNQWLDPAFDIDLFYYNIWNIQSANGIGLDIWGRIVGVPRTIQLSSTQLYFGFHEGNPSFYPFNNEPFYNGPLHGTLFTLLDDAYRVLILTKALANISNFTAPSINKLLAFMFAGRGSCYVLELSRMQIEYVFNFPLQAWEESVLLQSILMPRPAGVGVTIVVNP